MRGLSELGNLAADAIEEDTVAFISWFRDGRLITASQPFFELTGFTATAMETMKWPDDFGTQETAEHIMQVIEALDRGTKAYKHDGTLVRNDRSMVPVLLFVHKYCPGEGKEPYYYSFIVDLSAHKPAVDMLNYYEGKIRQHLDRSFNPVWVILGGKIAYANQPCADLLGAKNPGELIGTPVLDLIHPDYHETVKKRIELMLKEDRGVPVIEEKLIRLDGRVIVVELTALKFIFDRQPAILVIMRDVTTRMQAEAVIRESREILRMIMDNVPQRIFWKDTNSVYLGCNKYFAIAAGVGTPENIVGKTDYDLAWTRDQSDAFRRDDREVMDNDQPKYHIIESQLQADGQVSWLDTNKVPLHDQAGNVIGILGTYEDITDRMKLEEELRESRAHLLKAQQVAHLGSWEVNLRTNEMLWSDESFRILGFKPGEVKPDSSIFISVVHPADRERIIGELGKLTEKYALSSVDYRIIRRDGSVRYIHSEGEVTYSESGEPQKLFGINQDITDRKNVEIALNKREADLLFSQQIAHIGSWRLNDETGRNEWSDEFYHILGYEPGEVEPVSSVFMARVHPDDRELVIGDAKQALAENRPSSLDYRIIRPDGTIRYVHVEAVRIVADEQGRPAGPFGTIQDITDRKQVELSLEDAKVQAEMYLDLMGHDINNMDQIAMGFLEMALETIEPDSPAREFLLKPLEVLGNSTKLIQRVKKLQQTKEGGLALHDIYVGQVLTGVLSMFSDIPGRAVTIYTAIDCNCKVKANDLLTDVFENLIGNAIKHSTGPLTIQVSADAIRTGDRDYCRVSIEDNGPGIPASLKEHIFDRFKKGAKKSSGRGLGLYLVKSLVELYGGYVRVEDRVPGDYTQGVKFVVMLPVVK